MRKGFGVGADTSATRYLVNAGPLAKDSWYLNEEAEGSRFTGEGGHFIDTLSWWADSVPDEVYAVRGPEKGDVQATFRFANGASGTIAYLTGGNVRFPKETMDATGGGRSARLDNFRRLRRLDRAGQEHHEGTRRPGQGPAGRDGAVRRGRPDRRPDADQPRLPARHHAGHDRGGREPAQRSSGAGVSAAATSKLGWYARRLGRMSPAEVAWRVREQALRRAWARRQVRPGQVGSLPPLPAAPAAERRFTAVLPPDAASPGARRGQGRDHRGRGPAAQGRVGDARRRPHRHGAARLVPRPGDWPPLRTGGVRVQPRPARRVRRSATSSRSGRSTGCST